MGNLVSDLFSGQPDLRSVPAQQLSDFVRNSLEPSEECQKAIKWTVDAICCILKRDQQQPLIQDVARVSPGMGLGLWEPGRPGVWCWAPRMRLPHPG